MTASPWVMTIVGAATKYGASGPEAMMLPVPARWYATAGGDRVLLAQVAGREMRELSERGAAGVGERLHHADWVITGDRAQVEQIGMTHDCPDCAAGTWRALAWIDAHPGGQIAAGLLWWAARPPAAAP